MNETRCPGAGVCAIDQAWTLPSRQGGWCMCNTKAGLFGETCDDWCTFGNWIFTLNLLTSIFAMSLACFSLVFLVKESSRMNGRNKSRFSRYCTAPVAALAFVFLGSIFCIITIVLNSAFVLGFPRTFLVVEERETHRYLRRPEESLEYSELTFFALSDCFIASAIVILPLTWVS
jgi:amino acid transporter